MKVHMSDLNMKVCKFGKVEMDILFYRKTEHAPALGPLSLCHCKFVNEGAYVWLKYEGGVSLVRRDGYIFLTEHAPALGPLSLEG